MEYTKAELIRKEVYKARLEAEKIIKNAQNESCEILKIANQKKDQIIKDAFKDGVEKGIQSVCGKLDVLIANFYEEQQKLLKNIENQAGPAVVEIASKVLKQKITEDPGILTKLVNETLSELLPFKKVLIRFNPLDQKAFDNLNNFISKEQIKLEQDSSLKQGTLIFMLSDVCIDVSIDTQLSELKKVLT